MIEKWTSGPAGFLPKANNQLNAIENGLKLTGDNFINVRTTPAGKSIHLNLPAVLRCVRRPAGSFGSAAQIIMMATVAPDGGSEDNETCILMSRLPDGEKIADDWLPERIYNPADTVFYDTRLSQGNYNWTATDDYFYEPDGFEQWDADKDNYAAGDTVKHGDPVIGYEAKDGYSCPQNPYEPGTPEYDAWQVPAPPQDTDNWQVYKGHYPREGNQSWKRHEFPVNCIINGDSASVPSKQLKNCLPFLRAGERVLYIQIASEYYCLWMFTEYIEHEDAIW